MRKVVGRDMMIFADQISLMVDFYLSEQFLTFINALFAEQ